MYRANLTQLVLLKMHLLAVPSPPPQESWRLWESLMGPPLSEYSPENTFGSWGTLRGLAPKHVPPSVWAHLLPNYHLSLRAAWAGLPCGTFDHFQNY